MVARLLNSMRTVFTEYLRRSPTSIQKIDIGLPSIRTCPAFVVTPRHRCGEFPPAHLLVEMKKEMNSDLCIGIASRNETYEIATLEHGKTSVVIKFPATGMGVEAIKGLLASYGHPVRLAVAGVAAVSLALALGNVPGRETFIVSATIANQALALAHYAEHAV